MENKIINIDTVAQVAEGLKDLKSKMIFVGGAIVSLYTDDPSAEEIRPTQDIDLTTELVTYTDLLNLQDKLSELSIYPDPEAGDIISYQFNNIAIDIVPGKDGLTGPANKWYSYGFDDIRKTFAKDQEIQIFSPAVFIATKFEAFHSRGSDFRTSHDFEDIINVLNNCTYIVEDINKAHKDVISYIQKELNVIMKSPLKNELLAAHIHPYIRKERIVILEEKINKILTI